LDKNTKYTKDLYNKHAVAYAASIEKGRFYNKYIDMPAVKKIITNIKGRKVLDVGCGPGTYTSYFASKGAKVCAIDISEEMIKLTREKVPSAGVMVADMNKIPYPSGTFDLVFYGLSIHYLKDILPTLKEAYRVLKSKGKLVITTGNPAINGARLVDINGELMFVMEDYFGAMAEQWQMVPGMMIKNYTKNISGFINPVSKSGFRITKITEPKPAAASKKYNPVAYKRTTTAPSFIIIEAVK
jgi:ubiquinone/menaquinone biosynthesis C-methylase UbiE